MYEAIVKRLRAQADAERYFVGEDMLYDKAADAIEELSVVVRAQKAVLDKFPKWIPATERLPEATKEVIVCDKMPNGIRYVTTAWMREDCTFWNDCGKMYEVTHWMPLPELPKEALTGTDMRGGIRRDDAGNVIDWGITGPPGDVGKTEEE